jgi:hypothetical protein
VLILSPGELQGLGKCALKGTEIPYLSHGCPVSMSGVDDGSEMLSHSSDSDSDLTDSTHASRAPLVPDSSTRS